MEYSELKIGDKLYAIKNNSWYEIYYLSPNMGRFIYDLRIGVLVNDIYIIDTLKFSELKNVYLTEKEYIKHKRCSIIEELI